MQQKSWPCMRVPIATLLNSPCASTAYHLQGQRPRLLPQDPFYPYWRTVASGVCWAMCNLADSVFVTLCTLCCCLLWYTAWRIVYTTWTVDDDKLPEHHTLSILAVSSIHWLFRRCCPLHGCLSHSLPPVACLLSLHYPQALHSGHLFVKAGANTLTRNGTMLGEHSTDNVLYIMVASQTQEQNQN